MDPITKKVKEMYSQFPFPNCQGRAYSLSWFNDLDFLLASAGSRKTIDQVKVLDAGCGTGELSAGCANTFPQAHFTAIELNSTSLDIAKKKAKSLKNENIDFYQKNIMDIKDDLGNFDIIICSGVIHHLSQPELGLKHLAKLLKPDGIIAIYLYCKYTRDKNIRIKQAANIVEGDTNQVNKRIKIVRALLNDYQLRDIAAVDAYLHVNEHLYTVKSIFKLLKVCSLKFLRFRDEPVWDETKLIKDEEVVSMLQGLPDDLRYEVLDLAFSERRNRNAYEFFACHDSYTCYPVREIGKDTLRFYPMVTPFVRIEKESSNNSLYNIYILHDEKNPVCFQLTTQAMNIIKKCDGKKTLEQILEELIGDSRDKPTYQEMENNIFQFFNMALKSDLLFIRPVPSGKVLDNYKKMGLTVIDNTFSF